MMKKQVLLSVAMALSASGAALAADLTPIVYKDEPVYVAPKSFYLRGSLGMSNQFFDGLEYDAFDDPLFEFSFLDEGSFDSAPIVQVGIGYQLNDWLRGDLTAEYRGKSSFDALDRFVEIATGDITTNDYEAKKSEWLFLANAYADLGNYHGLVPYIGAGIGASRNTISDFVDVGVQNGSVATADKNSEWDFAWALHAGLGYQVTDQLTLDLGYSYIHLGDAQTKPLENVDPAFSRPNDGMKFKDIASHDFKLGLRYAFY